MAANKYTGTQTEKNLQEAFAGESQARNKYTYFASVAKKEGYEQMSALFFKDADNEKRTCKDVVQGISRNSVIQRKTWRQLQKAKIMSGQICMRALQKRLRKKVSMSLQQNSERRRD
jgi:Rubrerythrin